MTVRYRNLLSHRTGGNIIDFANGINKKRCRATNFVAHDRTTAETLGLWPAIVLKRLQYWQNLGKGGQIYEGTRYIFKSANELSKEIGCSPITVKRSIQKLRSLGLIDVKDLSKNRQRRVNHYSVLQDNLEAFLMPKDKKASMSSPLPEVPFGEYHKDTQETISGVSQRYSPTLSEAAENKGIWGSFNFLKSYNKKQNSEQNDVKNDQNAKNALSVTNTPSKNPVQESLSDTLVSITKILPSQRIQTKIYINNSSRLVAGAREGDEILEGISSSSESAFMPCGGNTLSGSSSGGDVLVKVKPVEVHAAVRDVVANLSVCALNAAKVNALGAGTTFVKEDTLGAEIVMQHPYMADDPQLTPLMNRSIAVCDESTACKSMRYSLLHMVGSATYKSWFHGLRFVEAGDGRVSFVPHESAWFNGEVKKRFGATMEAINKRLMGQKQQEMGSRLQSLEILTTDTTQLEIGDTDPVCVKNLTVSVLTAVVAKDVSENPGEVAVDLPWFDKPAESTPKRKSFLSKSIGFPKTVLVALADRKFFNIGKPKEKLVAPGKPVVKSNLEKSLLALGSTLEEKDGKV